MSKQKDRPDREQIAEKLYQQRWYESQPTWEKSLIKELFRNYADQIIALFPDEEDELKVVGMIRKQERVEIGLQIQQQWSKVTSAKDYSPYKLVDFLGSIITRLNKGQDLKKG